MHRSTLAWTQRRTWPSPSARRSLRPRALKNRLPRHRASGHGTLVNRRAAGRSRRYRTRRRSLIDRAWPGLRHNHARSRRLLRRTRHCWRSRRTRRRRRLGCGRCCHRRSSRRRRSCRRSRRHNQTRRRWCRRQNHARRNRSLWWRRCRSGRTRRRLSRWNCMDRTFRHLWRNQARHRRRRHRRCRRRRHDWWRGRFDWRRRRCRRRLRRDRGRCRTGRRRFRFPLLRNGLQHISGTGDVRQINLGLDFVFAAYRARRLGRGRLRLRGSADVGANFFRLVILNGTGVRLLLRDTNERECIKNRFALDFQLPG